MRQLLSLTLQCSAAGYAAGNHGDKKTPDIIGMNRFALATLYGTPASYQQQGECLQFNYGSAVVGYRVIVLVDQQQRVAGWASSGSMGANRAR
ncbi:hypothetical protein [Janthinobacterium sp. 75]|uniref:hypothetical protein n=1 Tax=Janthinobacterium sp. 75 TaxID=2135628 RepID=UPI0010627BC0|nr:hypothetical protein [Janthinobacterium sp. 75]TDY35072.1 hypothetical protein C8C89_2918 [Janthinobacterium sp. 75]